MELLERLEHECRVGTGSGWWIHTAAIFGTNEASRTLIASADKHFFNF
jgi:hypothetical protein